MMRKIAVRAMGIDVKLACENSVTAENGNFKLSIHCDKRQLIQNYGCEKLPVVTPSFFVIRGGFSYPGITLYQLIIISRDI